MDTKVQTIPDAETLARAMHDSDGWSVKGQPHLWEACNDSHRERYIALADRYIAAYKELL